MIRIRLVFWEIIWCIRFWTFPGDFFQINANYFNVQKGIFSKLETDSYIPEQWRLHQVVLDATTKPTRFPVFVKPEWGQNSIGIEKADNLDEFESIRNKFLLLPYDHLVQEAATETFEYEVFYLRKPGDETHYSVLSITQANNKSNEKYPINSIESDQTWYTDISSVFTEHDLDKIWANLGSIGFFKIARVCCRSESVQDLIDGKFHIVEINLFVPMPLYLESSNVEKEDKHHFIREKMYILGKLIRDIPKEQAHKAIFYTKWFTHIKMKSINQ